MVDTKKVILGVAGVAAAVAGATAAQASDLPSKSSPKAPAPSAGNWDGLYVGGQVGNWMGNIPGGYDETDNYEVTSGASIGAHVGYNRQFGSTVVGLEFAYDSGSAAEGDDPTYGDYYDLSNVMDAKLRVGQAIGDTLIYAVGGMSVADNTFYGNSSYSVWGFNVGAGAEMMLDRHLSVGVEYLYRNLAGNYDYNGDGAEEKNNEAAGSSQLMLRASYHF